MQICQSTVWLFNDLWKGRANLRKNRVIPTWQISTSQIFPNMSSDNYFPYLVNDEVPKKPVASLRCSFFIDGWDYGQICDATGCRDYAIQGLRMAKICGREKIIIQITGSLQHLLNVNIDFLSTQQHLGGRLEKFHCWPGNMTESSVICDAF